MADRKDIALVTIANDAFVDGCMTMIYSFLKHNEFGCDIVVMHSDVYAKLSERNQIRIKTLSDNIIMHKIDDLKYDNIMLRFKQKPGYIERFLPSVLTVEMFELLGAYEKILFLDSDILVIKSIMDVFKNENAVVCTPDSGVYPCKMDVSARFNGGFIYVAGEYDDTFLKRFSATLSATKRIVLMEQDILNIMLRGKIRMMDSSYNCLKRCFRDDIYRAGMIEKDIRAIHYVGEKPWMAKTSAWEKRYTKIELHWHKYHSEMMGKLPNV